MNKHILLMVLIMTLVIPGIVCSRISSKEAVPILSESTESTEAWQQQIGIDKNGEIIHMDLEDYVLCVILGEIPKDFESETLKAQAVATRTYTLKRVDSGRKHEGAELCTNPACCQAFCSISEYLRNGGSEEYITCARDAVIQTAGEVLKYKGQLIEATYFAASGGKTEAAVEVWGTDIPYLQSVDSSGEQAQQYENRRVTFGAKEFLKKIGLSTEYADHISCSSPTYTEGAGVESITICGNVFTGKKLRELLELPSTIFTVSVEGDFVTVTTEGNGHRVGLSQYGADAMAVAGKRYEEILNHYYPGTVLCRLDELEIKGLFDKADNL